MSASPRVIANTEIAAQAAADKFGTEIIALDLSEQSVLSEVFLIVTAQNVRQVSAISDWVEEKLRLAGDKPLRREISEEWALLDYSDLVVHIQSKALRSYYMIDRLWNDCPVIPLNIKEAGPEEEAVNG
jgi:ribosome-associated protein